MPPNIILAVFIERAKAERDDMCSLDTGRCDIISVLFEQLCFLRSYGVDILSALSFRRIVIIPSVFILGS